MNFCSLFCCRRASVGVLAGRAGAASAAPPGAAQGLLRAGRTLHCTHCMHKPRTVHRIAQLTPPSSVHCMHSLSALHSLQFALHTLHAHCTARDASCTVHAACTASLHSTGCTLHCTHCTHNLCTAQLVHCSVHSACTHLAACATLGSHCTHCMHIPHCSAHTSSCTQCVHAPHCNAQLIPCTVHATHTPFIEHHAARLNSCCTHCVHTYHIVHLIGQLTPPSECALHAHPLCTAQLAPCTVHTARTTSAQFAPCSVHTACIHLTLHTTLHISCFLLHTLHAHTLLHRTAHASHSERAWHTLIAQPAAPTVSSHCTHSPRISGCRADCQLPAHAMLQACMLLAPHTQRPWCCCSCSRASCSSPCVNTGCIHASLSLHTHTSRAACVPTPSVHTHCVAVLLLLHPRAGSSSEPLATGLQGTCCSLQAASASPRDQHKPDIAHKARGALVCPFICL